MEIAPKLERILQLLLARRKKIFEFARYLYIVNACSLPFPNKLTTLFNKVLLFISDYESLSKLTIDSPPPSCPAARYTFDKPGTGPITGFPSGTDMVKYAQVKNVRGSEKKYVK